MDTRPPTNVNALIEAARKNAHGGGLPPVHLWHPERCSEMDMEIRRDGSWYHDGRLITRARLVRLFSTILRKDDDGFIYLVTPVEKVRVRVSCAPFIAGTLAVAGTGKAQTLLFTTTLGDVVEAGPQRPIAVRPDPQTGHPLPFILVRGGLEALIARPVYYQLAELAVHHKGKAGVWSGGTFFALEPDSDSAAP